MKALIRVAFGITDRLRHRIEALVGRARLYSEGLDIGKNVRIHGVPIAQVAPMSRIAIENRVVLCSTSRLTALGVSHPVILRTMRPGASIRIGEDTGLSGTSICAAVSVVIGRRCLIGTDVLIADTDFHSRTASGRRHNNSYADIEAAPILIGDDVFVGAKSCILKGVTIGRGAIVGCGAVVTRDVGAGDIVAGNPARCVGRVPDMVTISSGPNRT